MTGFVSMENFSYYYHVSNSFCRQLNIFHYLQAYSVTSDLAFQRSCKNLKLARPKRNSSALWFFCPLLVALPFPDSFQLEALE